MDDTLYAAPITRPMTMEDLKAVCLIDRDAFETYRRRQRQLTHSYRLRTPENMEAALRRPYPGMVVEAPEGVIAGYCFTHVWGAVGWLGTLGVTPGKQGYGLGRAVIAAGLDLLREANCSTLALETMPESGKNLSLYIRLGMEPRAITMLCQGRPRAADVTHYTPWNGDDTLRAIASRIVPGLDPTPAAQWLEAENAGDTLVWHENYQPVAFAALRSVSRRLDGFQTVLTVEAAACLPQASHHWPRYLREMQAHAEKRGKNGLVMPVNARQITLLRRALADGFRIVDTRVRMVDGGALGGPDSLLLLTFAM